MTEYIINKTLFEHWLIMLDKFNIDEQPPELMADQNITVKIADNNNFMTFTNCHIDNTKKRRLRLPLEAILWIKRNFPFSVAFCSVDANEMIYKNRDTKEFFKNKKNGVPLERPAETLLLSWEKVEKGGSYLLIKKGFQITAQNAQHLLSSTAMATVLPYIFSSVENTSFSNSNKAVGNGKKAYIIDKTTPWLSAEQYHKTAFSHPGLYLLRRKDQNTYYYYVGKATDIKNRIVKSEDKICHPEEKDKHGKLYTEIACLSLNFDDIIRMYQSQNNFIPTAKHNPAVANGSKIDNAIFAIEDIAIHIVSMILQGEGKKLDNKQYRAYTSEALVNHNI